MTNNENKNRGRLLTILLASGLMLALVALISAPSLMAQDDVDPDTGGEVFITDSVEDLEALPPEVRARLQKENGLAAADAFEIDQSTKTAGRSTVLAGDLVTFTIVARNSGDADAPPLTVVDQLPDGLSYVESRI